MKMFRRGRRESALLVALLTGAVLIPAPAFATTGQSEMNADLEGKPIQLGEVSRYHCQDLDYPRIHCFRTEAARDSSAAPLLATSGVTYVIVWENPSFQGASLIVSQNYTQLVTLAWNDRISSFKAKNGLNGRFWTDWFYGGTAYYFCCNQQVTVLGSFDNTFSAIQQL